jgi:prepilin-type N-terminal cleavage/methylation domain-containing protein
MEKNQRRGFTFVEIIVALAVLSIICVISATAFRNMYRTSALRTSGTELFSALTEAQTKTLAAQNDTVYGVFVSSTTVTRFVGSTYSAATTSNKTYTFDGGVTATSSLITAGTPIVFAKVTGQPSVQGTIYLRTIDGSSTTTIVIYGSGLIEFE